MTYIMGVIGGLWRRWPCQICKVEAGSSRRRRWRPREGERVWCIRREGAGGGGQGLRGLWRLAGAHASPGKGDQR